MKFRYIGECPEGTITQYDVTFRPGEASEVTDETAIRKLSANRFFEAVDAAPAEAEKRGPGRPPKVKADG